MTLRGPSPTRFRFEMYRAKRKRRNLGPDPVFDEAIQGTFDLGRRRLEDPPVLAGICILIVCGLLVTCHANRSGIPRVRVRVQSIRPAYRRYVERANFNSVNIREEDILVVPFPRTVDAEPCNSYTQERQFANRLGRSEYTGLSNKIL